jgi:hypothetical protein
MLLVTRTPLSASQTIRVPKCSISWLGDMDYQFTVLVAEADPFGLECSACHHRFDLSQGEKLRNDVIAHLWCHASSEENVQDSAAKSQDVRAAL